MSLLGLVSVIFFTVCGGAYGLEPLVGGVGAGWAVLLVLLIPLVWSLPITMMVADLSSKMPEQGGYYVWIRNTLGNFWGVQAGWWSLCDTAVDMAIYPVLFVNYLAYFYPPLALDENGSASWQVFGMRWLIAVALIAAALALNWRGARAVGRNAVIHLALVLTPFALLVIIGLMRGEALGGISGALTSGLASQKEGLLALGLATILWNYIGWDNVTTFAGEVNDAQRNYRRALMVSLPLIVGAYALPLLAGISVTTDPSVWNESAGWPVIAEIIGGRWLGVLVAGAALVSAWSLFNSQLLYSSRLPSVMARDGWLPMSLARVSERTGVPTTALVILCAVSAVFAAMPFGRLVIIDILLYTAVLALEFVVFMKLRLREMSNPMQAPGEGFGLILMTLSPMVVAIVVVVAIIGSAGADPWQLLVVSAVIISGIALYYIRRSTIAAQRH